MFKLLLCFSVVSNSGDNWVVGNVRLTANPHTFICPAKGVHAGIESGCRRKSGGIYSLGVFRLHFENHSILKLHATTNTFLPCVVIVYLQYKGVI